MLLLTAVGCATPISAPVDGEPGCFDSDPEVACDKTFCEAPQVWPATLGRGGAEGRGFRLLKDGDSAEIWRETSGGAYYLELAAQVDNLCSVLFLDFELYDAGSSPETLIHSVRRHVQTSSAGDADRWEFERFSFPCAWWPEDTSPVGICVDPAMGQLDKLDLRLVVRAEDHNENRSATAEVALTSSCCSDPE